MRAEGYEISPSYEAADLVVVNTCGFIDAAVAESLDAIGEALAENGKVIVTGCLGAGREVIMEPHPKVLAVTGPHALQGGDGGGACASAAAARPLPEPDSAAGHQAHAQALRLSENLRGLQPSLHLLHHSVLRGDLVSRPVGEVMREAENLVDAGVRELLVISQDTSAYGLDLRYRTDFWQRPAAENRIPNLAGALGELGPGCGCTTSIPIRRWTS